MTHRWWVVEGDDHERVVVQATSPDDAVEVAAIVFSDQYDAPYSEDLLNPLRGFDSEKAAEQWSDSSWT